MPALEALVDKLAEARILPLGVSVDSRHSHLNWGLSLGGVSFPLLQDFHPKGALAKACGVYLEEAGITDRASIFIDAQGVVRFSESVTPGGERDVADLVNRCVQLAADYDGPSAELPGKGEIPDGATLYVKNECGFSRAVLCARDNLRLGAVVKVKNVPEDEQAMAELEKATGNKQAPCLLIGEDTVLESADITRELVKRTTGLWP